MLVGYIRVSSADQNVDRQRVVIFVVGLVGIGGNQHVSCRVFRKHITEHFNIE